MTDRDDARLIALIAGGPPETDGYIPPPFTRSAVAPAWSTSRPSRDGWLLAASLLVVVGVVGAAGSFLGHPGVAVIPSPVASPTLSPSTPLTTASLSVEAMVGEWCGSIGGCAYFVELRGAGGPWRAEFKGSGNAAEFSIGAGLPETLPAGPYTLILSSNLVSDVILNGARQLGPVNATCVVAFTVAQGQGSVVVRGSFEREGCSVTATGAVASAPSVDPTITPVSLSHPSAEAAQALSLCNVGHFGFRTDQVAGMGKVAHASDVTRYVPLTGREPELKSEDPVWVVAFSGRIELPRGRGFAQDPVCVLVGGDAIVFLPWGVVGSPDNTPQRAVPDLALPPLAP